MMKLRNKYIFFVAILHLTALALSYYIFRENTLLFIISEAFILLSAVIAWQLYLELIKPLKTLLQGANAIKDKDFNVKFLTTGKYELDQLILVYNEMIDHLRKERTKQEEQHFFLEKLIQSSPMGILVMDFDMKIYQANPRALQILGVEEKDITAQSLESLDHLLIREIRQLASGESKAVAINGVEAYKIQKSHFIDRGFERSFVVIEEVTEEILATEKKVYEKVIRFMAHEVNNTIGPVNSILHTTLQTPLQSEDLANALRVAIMRNDNLNHFVRNYADLVRLPQPVIRPVNLAALLQRVTQLMQLRTQDKNVQFKYDPGDTDIMIMADELQMEQVLINIIKNAMEAIEQAGTITILTNEANQLIIRDTGKGILPESEEKLFSPFFTTKRDGQGIGLMVIREILINHGFSFSLKTVQPGVTEFRLQFQ